MGTATGGAADFAYGAVTLYGRPFHTGSAIRALCNSSRARQSPPLRPTTPPWQRLPALPPCGFGLCPVRSPLLGASLLFSLPQGTEMFHFPWFPPPALCVQAGATRHDPCRVLPFGHPRIHACLGTPRGLSHPATSFFGFQCQGIHRMPFVTCRDDARARYGVLKGLGRLRRRLRGRRRPPGSVGAAARFVVGTAAHPSGAPERRRTSPSELHSVPTRAAWPRCLPHDRRAVPRRWGRASPYE